MEKNNIKEIELFNYLFNTLCTCVNIFNWLVINYNVKLKLMIKNI